MTAVVAIVAPFYLSYVTLCTWVDIGDGIYTQAYRLGVSITQDSRDITVASVFQWFFLHAKEA